VERTPSYSSVRRQINRAEESKSFDPEKCKAII
jgi:hypothetical protein